MPGFCNVPDAITTEANRQLCHWPKGMPVRWAVEAMPHGWSLAAWIELCDASFTAWNAVCGSKFVKAKSSQRPNVIVTTRRIDGPAGVLAEAELPCGRVSEASTLRVWFDTGDSFVSAVNPPRGKIDALAVATHEFGHTAGIGHAPNGEDAIMAAMYQPGSRSLLNWDIAQAVMRYGAPSTPPPIEPPVVPAGTTPADHMSSLLTALARLLLDDSALRRKINERLG